MSQGRRIVCFTPGHTEPNGGLANHSRRLVEGFVAAGWEVRVVARAGSYHRPRWIRRDGLAVLELPGFGRRRLGGALYLAIAVPLGIVWARRAQGALALHLGTTTVAAGLAASAWGRPYIALSTSSGPRGEIAEAAAAPPSGLRRRILRRATWLVAQSTASARELVELTDDAHVTVVPNPIDLPEPQPLTGEPNALFLGRLSVDKDPMAIIDAWREVAARRPDARLGLVGAGGDWHSVEPEVRAAVAGDPSLQASVTFRGWVADASPVLAEHDVFVQCSRTEGMSNSLLEACAHGRVVVASDIPANVEVLGADYPLLYPVGDTAALASAVLAAFDDDELRGACVGRTRAAVARNAVGTVVAAHGELLAQRGAATRS